MKRIVCLILILTVALCSFLPAEAASKKKNNENGTVTISGTLKAPWTVKNDSKLYELNPVIEGENLITGLPSSGEVYTPITMILDNAGPENGKLTAYPHWGVKEADIIFQVPNAGVAATKLMALYTDEFPEAAGGIRSGRTGFYPVAKMFDAAFLFYGFPSSGTGDADLQAVLNKDKTMYMNKKWFNLIGGGYSERIKGHGAPHNVSVNVKKIHERMVSLLESGDITVTPYPFKFTDEPRTEGDSAEFIEIIHRGNKATGDSNPASYSTFTYVPEKGGYIRTNSSGDYIDGNDPSGEPIIFTNVIVLRTAFKGQGEYVWEKNFMVNSSGAAEIFQNGKYVRGAWSRNKDTTCRLLLTEKVDKKVRELEFQRGKTFIVITNDITEVNIK